MATAPSVQTSGTDLGTSPKQARATRWRQILLRGTIAGLAGYAATVVAVFIGDLLLGRPAFFTPALLGSALFYDLTDPSMLVVWAGPVIAYNGLHLIVFLALGVFAAWLAAVAARGPDFWYVSLGVFIVGGLHLLSFVVALTEPVRAAASWSLLGVATVLAAAAVVTVIWRLQPELSIAMHGDPDYDVTIPTLPDSPGGEP